MDERELRDRGPKNVVVENAGRDDMVPKIQTTPISPVIPRLCASYMGVLATKNPGHGAHVIRKLPVFYFFPLNHRDDAGWNHPTDMVGVQGSRYYMFTT